VRLSSDNVSAIEVSVRQDKGGEKLSVMVDDNGPELTPEARDVVFNIGERWTAKFPDLDWALPSRAISRASTAEMWCWTVLRLEDCAS
jgi:hypothetical protein